MWYIWFSFGIITGICVHYTEKCCEDDDESENDIRDIKEYREFKEDKFLRDKMREE